MLGAQNVHELDPDRCVVMMVALEDRSDRYLFSLLEGCQCFVRIVDYLLEIGGYLMFESIEHMIQSEEILAQPSKEDSRC